MATKDQCPVCVASRRSVVDAYILGYLAGKADTISSVMNPYTEPDSDMCIAHAKLVTLAEIAQAGQFFVTRANSTQGNQ